MKMKNLLATLLATSMLGTLAVSNTVSAIQSGGEIQAPEAFEPTVYQECNHVYVKHNFDADCVNGGTAEYYTCENCSDIFVKDFGDAKVWRNSVYYNQLQVGDVILAGCRVLPSSQNPTGKHYLSYSINHGIWSDNFNPLLPENAEYDFVVTNNNYPYMYVKILEPTYKKVEAADLVVPASEGAHKFKKVNGFSSCEEDGWKDYYVCETCGKYFSDMYDVFLIGGEDELAAWKTGAGKVEALGHQYTHVEGNDACITYEECERCGKMFTSTEDTTVTVHSESVYTKDIKAGDYIEQGTVITREGGAAFRYTFYYETQGSGSAPTPANMAMSYTTTRLLKVRSASEGDLEFYSDTVTLPCVYTEVTKEDICRVYQSENTSAEALIEDGKATVRFIWELNPIEGVTINTFGAYIIPFALFNNQDAESAIVTITPDKEIVKGETFAADLANISESAFDTEIYAIPTINGQAGLDGYIVKVNDIKLGE